jgi:hypothetical protein
VDDDEDEAEDIRAALATAQSSVLSGLPADRGREGHLMVKEGSFLERLMKRSGAAPPPLLAERSSADVVAQLKPKFDAFIVKMTLFEEVRKDCPLPAPLAHSATSDAQSKYEMAMASALVKCLKKVGITASEVAQMKQYMSKKNKAAFAKEGESGLYATLEHILEHQLY